MPAAELAAHAEKAWWWRTLLVLQAPRSVFAALRDESEQAASARQEPVTAIVFLAGVAAALAAARDVALLDDEAFDGVLTAVWVVAAGGVQGFAGYWLLGTALFLGLSGVGQAGTARRARHVLAFACVPITTGLLLVWPLRVAAFGGDVFRQGGDDTGALALALDVAEGALYVWAVALLLVGVRTVYAWSWARSLAACGVAVGVLGGAAAGLTLLG